jgi:hypothetical protein
MKYVSSVFTINDSALKEISEQAIRALELTGDYVLGEVVDAQVVPFGDSFERGGDTHQGGTLQDSGYVNKQQSAEGSVFISFNTPYARRLYFHPEYNFRTTDNPNAKGKWLEDWAKGGKYEKDVKNAYEYFFKQ